ncbi:MAG: hypothetical protein ACLQDY_03090 [Streptosporangiaceae bacterium]
MSSYGSNLDRVVRDGQQAAARQDAKAAELDFYAGLPPAAQAAASAYALALADQAAAVAAAGEAMDQARLDALAAGHRAGISKADMGRAFAYVRGLQGMPASGGAGSPAWAAWLAAHPAPGG